MISAPAKCERAVFRRMASGLLYSVRQIDTKEERRVAALDGEVGRLRRSSTDIGKEGASDPKFSPDGRYISFFGRGPVRRRGTRFGDWTGAVAKRSS